MRRSFDRSTMAPLPCSHHLRTAPVRVGTSKAQAGLARIIAIIISTVPPPPIKRRGGNSEAARAGGLGFDIDLNLRLGPPPEIGGGGESSGNDEEGGGGPTAQSVVAADVVAERVESGEESTVEKDAGRAPRAVEESSAISPAVRSSEGECDPEEESQKETAGGAKESSGITTAPSGKADDGDEDEEAVEEVVKKERNEEAKGTKGGDEGGDDGEGREEAVRNLRKGNGSEGYLDLLLEAVRQVSGGLFDEESAKEKEETADVEEERPSKRRAAGVAQGSKRRGAGWLPFDLYVDSAPIVRSKRGRNQALPSRYRDSVLDPWRKLPTVSRHGRAARP